MSSRPAALILALALSACGHLALTPQRGNDSFNGIHRGVSTRADVQRALGQPDDTSYLALRDLSVWSYRYKENGVWDSMMHIMFDRDGVVRDTQSGPDPEKEDRDSSFRWFHRTR